MDLLWRPTWPDSDNDYSAFGGSTRIGRIYAYSISEHHRGWKWHIAIHGPTPVSGTADSRRAAMVIIEDLYGKHRDDHKAA